MTARDFCYWLQGTFEVASLEELNKEQTQTVKNHLNLVFVHEIDPSMGDEKHQAKLNEIHHANSSDSENHGHGSQPQIGWKLSSLHGWYDPNEGIPRC